MNTANLSRPELQHHGKMLQSYAFSLHGEMIEQTLPPASLVALAIATAHHANAILEAIRLAQQPEFPVRPLSEATDRVFGEGRR